MLEIPPDHDTYTITHKHSSYSNIKANEMFMYKNQNNSSLWHVLQIMVIYFLWILWE